MALLSFSLLAAVSHAKATYEVTVDGTTGGLTIAITTLAQGGKVDFQIPNWAPGSYRLANHYKSVSEVKAWVGGSEAVPDHPTDTLWSVPAGDGKEVRFQYQMPGRLNTGTVHFSGPSTYMYMVGRLKEPIVLRLKLPESWASACGLDSTAKNEYSAPGYDVLADNPVTVGNFVSDTYTVNGVPHQIVYHSGDSSGVDRKKVIDFCTYVTKSQADFWGGLPFKKYVWHFTPFNAQDGGWGLEHLSSTQIGLATGLGQGTISVCSHEYFHAWNVKRVRSSVLGPFDYQVLPKTGALWWLEGVTDYYADVLLHRYGYFGDDYFMENILSNVNRTRSNQQRFEVSPYDASYRVGEAANGQGNSSGFGVNYYNTGWLLGLCLDIELRTQTAGRRSLDDVARGLYEVCKDGKPGFAEDEIRKQLVKFGGDALGTAYDNWVMKPGELPVEEQLAKMGLVMTIAERELPSLGIAGNFDRTKNVLLVGAASGNAEQLFEPDDVIVSIAGKEITAANGNPTRALRAAEAGLKIGSTVDVVIRRGSDTKTVSLQVGARTVSQPKIEAGPTHEATKKLRDGWYFAAKPRLVP